MANSRILFRESPANACWMTKSTIKKQRHQPSTPIKPMSGDAAAIKDSTNAQTSANGITPERLEQICKEWRKHSNGSGANIRLPRFCASLTTELGISRDMIDTAKIQEATGSNADLINSSKKVVKCVADCVRFHLALFSLRHQKIEVGKPLPNLGAWQGRGLILDSIGPDSSTFRFKSANGGSKGTVNPLDNAPFIDYVFSPS